MAEFETITYGVHDAVATIEMARPQKLNAMNAQMFTELGQAARAAGTDPGVRVVLLKGQGKSFSAGIDVALLGQLSGTRGARFRTFVRTAQLAGEWLTLMEKPTVAAIHGNALGAGFQLALSCDLRIAADDVQLALPEIRFGIVPDLGGPFHLTRLIGPARTKEIVWTGRTVEADEALQIGLVNRVIPAAELAAQAEAYARALVHSPPIPVSLSKTLISRAHENAYEASLEAQGHAQARCIESEDHKEAVEAFLEKRTPRFSGQ